MTVSLISHAPELWAPILEGAYAVSTLGRVKRLAGGKGAQPGQILKPALAYGGYMSISLRVREPELKENGRKRYTYRHYFLQTLVLSAHRRPARPGEQARFKNGDRLDCRLENLYWHQCRSEKRPSENVLKIARNLREDGWRIERDGRGVHWLTLNGHQVKWIRPDAVQAVGRVLARLGLPEPEILERKAA